MENNKKYTSDEIFNLLNNGEKKPQLLVSAICKGYTSNFEDELELYYIIFDLLKFAKKDALQGIIDKVNTEINWL